MSHVTRVLAHASTDPDRVVLAEPGRQVTAAGFALRVTHLCGALAAAGLAAGDRIAIVPTSTIDALAVRYAALLLGCPTALCPNTGVPGRLAGFVSRLGADALVAFPKTAAAAAREVQGVTRLAVGEVEDALNLDAATGDPAPHPRLISPRSTPQRSPSSSPRAAPPASPRPAAAASPPGSDSSMPARFQIAACSSAPPSPTSPRCWPTRS
jgi:acyl-CoA synthetase (AMP-forming)/AMP-acid ligase II